MKITVLSRHPRQAEEGGSLLVCLGVIFLTALIVGGALFLTQGVARNATRTEIRSTAVQMGLGALDMAYASWRQTAREKWAGHPTTDDLSTIKKAVIADFNNAAGYSLTNINVTAVTPQLVPIPGSTAPVAGFGPNNLTQSYYYLATVDVAATSLGKPITTKVRRIFEKEILSPWDYAIFYDDDLEIHPGPAQTITGWVHTNGALYTGHSSLTFGSRVTNVRGWTVGFMAGDGQHPKETPVSPYYQADIPPAKDTNHQPFGIDPWAIFAARNPNGSNEGWLELIKRPVPGVLDKKTDARYFNQADIRILVDNGNNLVMTDQSGVVINASSTGKSAQLYNAFKTAVTTNGSLQDNREATTVRLVTLDISKITNAVNASPSALNFNGIVYIADTSAGIDGATPRRGVKLINAAVMPSGGLAVVSENPVYLQGNVNTGPSNPPSNTSGNFSQPTSSGYTRQPVLIAGDSINILSEAWNDSKSTGDLSGRKATNTTVNAALLAGIVPTGTVGNNYSGGAENFPRFLEDWDGVNLTYYGSIVCLYDSDQAKGVWGKSSVYNPPKRQWYFDTLLRQHPPPGTLTTTNFLKARWWTE